MNMRTLALVVAAIIGVSGCTTTGGNHGRVTYSDAALRASAHTRSDSVSATKSQLYLLQRQFSMLQKQFEELAGQKSSLEHQLTQLQYDKEALVGGSSGNEAGRVKSFHEATVASQTRVAESDAKLENIAADWAG